MEPQILAGHLARGGWTMLPLIACSVLAAGLLLHKVVEFWRHGVGDRTVLSTAAPLLRLDRLDELETHCLARATPVGRVMAVTAAAARDRPARAQAIGLRAADAEISRYDAWIPALGWIGQVAPLFGLLGTVVGMVELFSSIEAAGALADTATITGGIWKALLTTAAGLVVAIPTLGVHLWLARRLQALEADLDEAVGLVVDVVESSS